MYFPYMRGKQFELIALREAAENLQSRFKCTPIIEPVKSKLSSLDKVCYKYSEFNLPLILIVNPLVGDFKDDNSPIINDIVNKEYADADSFSIGFIISSKTTEKEIEDVFSRFKSKNLSIIHLCNYYNPEILIGLIKGHDKFGYNIFIDKYSGHTYRGKFSNSNNVLIKDGFIQRKNADYPDDEFFSDLHTYYLDFHLNGFGDYLMVGEDYSETGGPAFAVAIHITYKHSNEDIWIKHFISDRIEGPIDTAGKFFEALKKLTYSIKNNEVFLTKALKEYLELYDQKHFPGLGYVKKLSMLHHLELIINQVGL